MSARLKIALVVAPALVLGWLGLLAPAAWAHASLVGSSPAPGSSVTLSPKQLVFTFAEPPDPAHSTIEVLGPTGQPAPGASAARPFPGNPLQLVVDLSQPLPKGVYTVNWKTVSALDGHADAGTMLFGVRETPPQVSQFGKKLGQTPAWLNVASDAGRWLLYWGLALLVGAAGTCLISFRATLPRGGRVLLRAAWLVAAVGLAVMVMAEKRIVGAPSLLPLFQTQEGHAFINLLSALAICIVAVILADVWPNRWTLWALGATGALALFIHVQAGHADAATPRLINLVVQWVHVMAVGVWIGGLVWLLLGLRTVGSSERRSAAARFSTAAGICLGLVLVTGIVRAMAEIASPSDLFTTSYGVTLLVKICLVVVIALLGALNRYRQLPALLQDDDGFRPFRMTVSGEVAVAAAILAATAVLAGLAPAATVARGAAAPAVKAVPAAAPRVARVAPFGRTSFATPSGRASRDSSAESSAAPTTGHGIHAVLRVGPSSPGLRR